MNIFTETFDKSRRATEANREVTTYNISFEKNGVYQANLIKGYSEEQVEDFFKKYKPDAKVLGVKVATKDDERPGKPVIDATSKAVKEDVTADDPEWDDTWDSVEIPDMKMVSIAFDIGAPAEMTEAEIETKLREVLSKSGFDVYSYMELHTQE